METTLQPTSRIKQKFDGLLFNVPTPITKLEPIFTFNFKLTDFPSFTINLNPKLKTLPSSNGVKEFNFNELGNCNFSLNEADEYFIKGELKLVAIDGDEVSHCKIVVDYGKGTHEQYLLKGTFKLSDFSA